MRITAFTSLVLGFGICALLFGACANSAGDCTATASCGTSGGRKKVYVCLEDADYCVEEVSIDTSSDGVRIYGGFKCSDWSYDTGRYAAVKSPDNTPIALRMEGLKKGAHIENLSFTASDA